MLKKPLTLAISSAIGLYALGAPAAFAADEESNIDEEVVVTGSRIARGNLTSATPVTVLDAETLKISANTNIADTLFELPSTGIPGVAQTTSNFNVFASGIATVDLRNLGTTRTLVLVNGRRHVSGDIDNPSVVDLNSIPAAFIERIEVITGGASAVYGSEAMAGVINIITKKDFEGMEIDTQYGISNEGDGQDFNVSITGGSSFADGKGHAMVHLGLQELSSVDSIDRPLSATDNFFGDFQSFSSFAPQGSINAPIGTNPDGSTQFGFVTQDANGDWVKPFVSAEDGFNRAAFRKIQLPLTRKNINVNLNYEISENTKFFVETSYTQTDTSNNLEPTIAGQFLSVGANPLTIPGDNPFIPDEIRQAYTDAGSPLTADDDIVWRKRFFELGPRQTSPSRDTIRAAFGLEGELESGSRWDVYYQFGQTNASLNRTGDFNTLFFSQGLDAEPDPDNPGQFRCKDALARSLGCVAIDVFGVGSISDAAVDYVRVPASSNARLQQQVVGGNLTGDLFEWGGGMIKYATGFEYRKEQYDRTVDALAAAGLSSSNASAPVSGNYDVWEIYGEVDVPIIQDAPGADYLGFDAAYRYGDYSTVGGVSQWKTGLKWTPFSDLTVRVTQSQAVRAPNVAELFDPGSETFESFTDPCINGGAGAPGNTAANCASLGIPSNFDPGVNGSSAGGFQSGNPRLTEETSDSTTIGFVYVPSWAEGMSLTVDYFDIEIEDAVEPIEPQIKLDQCYAAADFPNNPFCVGIQRNGANLGFIINRLDFGIENIGRLSTQGVDIDFNWQFDAADIGLGEGTFSWNSRGTFTTDWERVIFDELEDNLREPGYNEVKWNNRLSWNTGAWTHSWTWRYIGQGSADNSPAFQGSPLNDIGHASYHDLNTRYVLEGDSGATYEFSAGINNALDNDPPYIPEPSENADTGTGTAAGVYDPIGRFFYVGATVRF
ncbi:TonB-dependent receptor [Porticoccus sp. W117]|uniref:TonB-dependent receptor plug domain-containing protein n=1 Tax=Porticoccus sp. W117 TaxID=3054777 RepID=UPI002596FCF6|nr:TonB-dependent receptor [Porticoccus sp. W117]MDM3870854.1 TonB-dependent receptor [Porticoccus sp. W117]